MKLKVDEWEWKLNWALFFLEVAAQMNEWKCIYLASFFSRLLPSQSAQALTLQHGMQPDTYKSYITYISNYAPTMLHAHPTPYKYLLKMKNLIHRRHKSRQHLVARISPIQRSPCMLSHSPGQQINTDTDTRDRHRNNIKYTMHHSKYNKRKDTLLKQWSATKHTLKLLAKLSSVQLCISMSKWQIVLQCPTSVWNSHQSSEGAQQRRLLGASDNKSCPSVASV